MTEKIKVPEPVTGYGYVGQFSDDLLGWAMPDTVDSRATRNGIFVGDMFERYGAKGDKAFLCEILISPVFDKAGRPITVVHK